MLQGGNIAACRSALLDGCLVPRTFVRRVHAMLMMQLDVHLLHAEQRTSARVKVLATEVARAEMRSGRCSKVNLALRLN